MPEVHIFGCIDAASCFPTRGRALQVRWRLEFDSNIEVIAGPTEGLTKVAEVEGEDAIIDEPIDVHLNVTSLLRGGPPRLVIDVWHEDDNSRFELSGYGFAHPPVAPEDDLYGLRTETTGVVYFHADIVVGS